MLAGALREVLGNEHNARALADLTEAVSIRHYQRVGRIVCELLDEYYEAVAALEAERLWIEWVRRYGKT